MGSHLYYFDYFEEDLHTNDNGYSHKKNTKSYQRQASSGGPTTFLKPRRNPPPVPRRLPIPKAGNPRETKNLQPVHSPSRQVPPVPYRLYSIPEKEEEPYGDHFQRRRVMSEQKPHHKSSDSLLSISNATGLPSSQSELHGSMPDMSSSGNLKLVDNKEMSTEKVSAKMENLDQGNSLQEFSNVLDQTNDSPKSLDLDEGVRSQNQVSKSNEDNESSKTGLDIEPKEKTSISDFLRRQFHNLKMFGGSHHDQDESLEPEADLNKDGELPQTRLSGGSHHDQDESPDSEADLNKDDELPQADLSLQHIQKSKKSHEGLGQTIQSDANLDSRSSNRDMDLRKESDSVLANAELVDNKHSSKRKLKSHDVSDDDLGDTDEKVGQNDDTDDLDYSFYGKEPQLASTPRHLESSGVFNFDGEDEHINQVSKSSQLKVEQSEHKQFETKSIKELVTDSIKTNVDDDTAVSQTNGDKETALAVSPTYEDEGTAPLTKSIEQSVFDEQKTLESLDSDTISKHEVSDSKLNFKMATDLDAEKRLSYLRTRPSSEFIPLKTTDSVKQYFAKPSDLLKRKLKNESIISQEKSNVDTNQGTTTNVVKYDEKTFKEAVNSKLQKQDTFDSETGSYDEIFNNKTDSNLGIQSTEVQSDTEIEHLIENEAIDDRNDEEDKEITHSRKNSELEMKPSSEVSRKGYEDHHDFTSVVDFVEVLKMEEDEANKVNISRKSSTNSITPSNHSDTRSTHSGTYSAHNMRSKTMVVGPASLILKPDNVIDNNKKQNAHDKDNDTHKNGVETRKQKYVPSVPSPLTLANKQSQGQEYRKTEFEGKEVGSEMSNSTPSELLEKIQTRESHEKKERSSGYGEMDYTTPSTLGMESQPGKKVDSTMSYSTPSKLLEYVQTRESREKKEESTGYGEIEYTTPSTLGMDTNGGKKVDSTMSYNTPSKLLEKVQTRESHEKRERSIGYGEMDYTAPSTLCMDTNGGKKVDSTMSYSTPSKLLENVQTRESCEKRERSIGYGEIDYITPSTLGMDTNGGKKVDSTMSYSTPSKLLENVQTRESREKKERSAGYGEMDYTTPSTLGMDKNGGKKVDSTMSYSTPSKLLEKIQTRESREKRERSTGYGEFEYTTPSTLGMESQPGKKVDSTMSYSTPSKLLENVQTRESREKKEESTGYGEMDYTTPSTLDIYTNGGKQVDSTMSYSTPSKLLEKVQTRESHEKRERSTGYGEFEYTTPSTLRMESQPGKKVDSTMSYSTPSKLLEYVQTRESRETKEGSTGYGEIEYTTPSTLGMDTNGGKQVDPTMSYSTPSKLLEKVQTRESREKKERSAGYGEMDYTTPSTLGMDKNGGKQVDSTMSYSTPSKLLEKVQTRESREKRERSTGDGEFEYTTPSTLGMESQPGKKVDSTMSYSTLSKLLENVQTRESHEKKEGSTGYGEIEYTTPSKLGMDTNGGKKVDSTMSYSTPSKLLEKVQIREAFDKVDQTVLLRNINDKNLQDADRKIRSPTVSEIFDSVRKGQDACSKNRSPTVSEIFSSVRKGQCTESQNDRSPTVSEVFDSVRRGRFGPRVSGYATSSSPSLSLSVKNYSYGDSKTSFMQEQQQSLSQKASNKKLDARPKKSGLIKPATGGQNDTNVEDDNEHIIGLQKFSSWPDKVWETEKKTDDQSTVHSPLKTANSDTGKVAGFKSSTHDTETNAKRRESNIFYMHSDITAYFPNYDDITEGYPSKRHKSEPEVYHTFSDISKQDSFDTEEATGNYDIQSTEHLQSSSDSSKSTDNSASPGTSQYNNAYHGRDYATARDSSWMEYYYNNREHISRKRSVTELDNESATGSDPKWSWVFPTANRKEYPSTQCSERSSYQQYMSKPSFASTGYPSSLDTYDIKGLSMTPNPSYQEVTPSNSEESLMCRFDTNDTASVNQIFWSLYSSHPNLMQQYIDMDTHTPSQSALKSLSDLYGHALYKLARPEPEGRYSTGSPKKRSLTQSPGNTTPETRSFMEKEVMESQNRKLQMEITTLTTENKLLKEKYNRATGKINDLEEELQETREQLETLQLSVNQEVLDVQRKSKSEVAQDIEQLNIRVTSLVHENESLKSEIVHLEAQLQAASSVVDMARHNSEKNKTVDAYKMEVTSLKDEVVRLKSLLEQSEHHLNDSELHLQESTQQVIKLTEMKSLLQQQVDLGGGGNTVVDKQIKSLEKRLKVTEERLHQERSDRANNLSQVEDKLLTENARLQAAEKELSRQLQREKDKNRNLEQKIKDTRNENEKLRLQVPFDETSLSSEKYDIPYSSHSSQRHETVKKHDFKHIITQLEQQMGIRSEKDMICHLWSTREQAFFQLRQWEIMLQDLNLRDNDATEGLKNLRDLKCQYEMKLKQCEEKVEDARSEKLTFESTYKEQLATLVKERHEAFAKLKTAEDLLEATRSENEILRKNLPALSTGAVTSLHGKDSQKESLQVQVQTLEGKVQLLMRSNQVLEGEISTLKVQMESRENALKDVESELELANSRLELNKSDDRQQQKIDKLTVQVNSQQAEIGLLNDKYNRLLSDNRTLEREIEAAKQEVLTYRSKQKGPKTGGPADNKFSMEEELQDKTRRLASLSEEVNKLDSELQQTRQDLYQEQVQSNDYESQIESLQQQFEERGRIIDAISETENEQLVQYKVLKQTFDSLNTELKNKVGKLKMVEIELSQQKDKVQQLERQLESHQKSGEVTPPSTILVDVERDKLKAELLEACSKLKAAEEEIHEMAAEIQELQEEVTSQKSDLLQLSSEKGELEQHLEEIAEEHDALIQEKAQSEEDIVKLENKLQELVETLENEARKQHENFESQYSDIPPQYKQIVEEIDTLRSLMEAKDKELDMFQIKSSRQQMDIEFLQRRIELLHSDNQSNREDIARMTNQLIFKIKEGTDSRQLNEYLSTERIGLQEQVTRLETNMQRDKDIQTVKQSELEKSEMTRKESAISALESRLEQVKKSLQETEYDNVQLRYKLEALTEDQRKMSTINSSLETKLDAEKKMYDERQQEVVSLTHKLDLLQREHDHVLNNLNTEKQVKDKLNNDYHIYASENENLRQEVKDMQRELEESQRQLMTSQESLTNAKQDKGVMYHEYENMVKRLNEKDQKIIELQAKLDMTVADMEKELHLQKHTHDLEKTSTERELEIQREHVNTLNAEVKTRETELSTFGRTLHELEEAKRQKEQLEKELKVTQNSVNDLKILLESHKKDIQILQDSVAKYQETISKTQLAKAGVEDELHRLKESTTVEIVELKKTKDELKNANDGEKHYLKDSLTQTQSKIQSLESTIASAIQSRDKYQMEYRLSQQALEETKEKLQEETTARKVAEQRAETFESQLHENRKERFLAEEKHSQSQSSVSKLERELKSEKEKLKLSTEKCQEWEAIAFSHETTANSKQDQINILQNEISKLKQILESQKLQMNSKLKKSALEMSQQMELIELDRNKLSQQNTVLFTDLEKSRETVQTKNKENLKLQEDMLQLQDQVKEYAFKLRHSEETHKAEEELQSKLQTKLQEQEEELKKVKNFLSKKAEESGEAEKSVWYEMNKMIQDMSKQMSMHIESQKVTDKDKDRDTKVIQKYKKQIHDLNTELQTERALHKITAASLQNLEEDCVRLRQQCQAMRRRNNSASDKKYKSRMEAINEIIARSQAQAQTMLSTGNNYLDDSFKSLASPRVTFDTSPDNSICSDMSFNSTIAVNEPSPSKPMKSTPRKS